MTSIGRRSLTPLAVLVLALLSCSCRDSGHLLGQARGTGGTSSAGSGGTSNAGTSGTATGGSPGGSGGTTGTGGASAGCVVGTWDCACFGDGTCSVGLECQSGLCIAAASGGNTSNGGTTSMSLGGNLSAGGATGTGGTIASGGSSSSGGASGTGGSQSSGGSGGIASAGGTTGGNVSCGGPAGVTCPSGQFCDLASNCGQIPNANGICVPTGWNTVCPDQDAPVCGCENKTYPNDCQRQAAGMLKASNGVCPNNGFSYPTAYLAWQAPWDAAGSGPAVVVVAASRIDTWDNTVGFEPESPPPNPTSTQPLAAAESDDLFLRLAGVNLTTLPHGPQMSAQCHPTLTFRLCKGCAINTLAYDVPQQLAPEMEIVWTWFDRTIGGADVRDPRNYCSR